ncbi:MAG: hypothetical protein V9G19_05815 [Tetrasphaera sp.]
MPGASALGALEGVSGGGAATAQVGGRAYVFPRSLRPVIGTVFDPELFDVTALADRPGGRTAVTIDYASATGPTAVPGVEVTSRSGTRGSGVITPASARALRRQLSTRSAQDLFTGVARVAGPVAGAANAQRWPMHTVTIEATGVDGRPLNDIVIALAVDDPAKGGAIAFIVNGRTKLSLPAGRYTLLGSQLNTTTGMSSLAMTPDFAVTGPTTTRIDIRSATTPVTFGVAAPVEYVRSATSLLRLVGTGEQRSGASLGTAGDGQTRVLVTPTRKPALGEILLQNNTLAYARSGAADGRYALNEVRSGAIPATPLTVTTPRSSLSTVASVIHGPAGGLTSLYERAVLPYHLGGWFFGEPVDTPGRITEYLSTGTDVRAKAFLTSHFDAATGEESGVVESEWRPLPHPTSYTEEWLRAPLSSFIFSTPNVFAPDKPVCFACVFGDKLMLNIFRGDSYPWHIVYADRPGGRPDVTWRLTADGRNVATGEDYLASFDGPFTLPANTRVLGATIVSRRGAPFTTSTKLTSTWSQPLRSAAALPAGWECPLDGACRVVPLVTLGYRLPVDLTGHVSAGSRTLRLEVAQVGRRVPTGIASVTAEVDYGSGWLSVPVRDTGSGSYAATLTVPTKATGRTAANLRVTVRGSDGSRFTETTENAFLIR